ncbi:MAG: hypothetical protein LWX02_08000 [Deltaproteobacteria bacterium]|jgi:hypothetical protein|nr:hypothetical protein [Deltaproteobacteria bacterium]MDL1988077.1 hypothetical protein [Deltaproteobacteria bacterium]MDL2124118.1 hypothetical protein [Deltaproteobacteria bacterium]
MRSKIIGLVTFIALLVSIFGPINVWAEDKPTASADVGIFNKYVWRGYEFSKDSIVIQPSATVGYKNFGFNLWGNIDTEVDGEDEGQFNETDMTLSYEKSFGPACLGLGYIYYGLDGIDDSHEVFLSIGLDALLSPTLTVYREIAHIPSWYLSFAVSHSFELPKDITLDLAGTVGYYYSDDDDFVEMDENLNPTTEKYRSMHDGLISAGLTIPMGEYFTLSPMVAYSFPLTDKADDNIAGTNGFSDDSDYFFGGATMSIAF